MSREIEPSNLVFEPRYEEHGTGKKAVNVVYTPEGEYLLDVEVTNLDEGTHYSFVMDAGVVGVGGFKELFDQSEIEDSIRVVNEVPVNNYLGNLEEVDRTAGMKVDWYKISDDDWEVGVQNPADEEFPARLDVYGFSNDIDEVARELSVYAEKVGAYSLNHSSRHDESCYSFDESDVSGWSREDWEDVIKKAVQDAVDPLPDFRDEVSMED